MKSKPNAFDWIWEPLSEVPSCDSQSMFGCKAIYLYGRMVLVLADQDEPWNGLLFPTDRAHHPSLCAAFPSLNPHPILGKWLYLSQQIPEFEACAAELVQLIRQKDARLGIEPNLKRRSRKSSRNRI